MHPDEAALLKAVCAAPDDDLPRLVFADWLDEHGEPLRAEFIRSQIELAKLTPPRKIKDSTDWLRWGTTLPDDPVRKELAFRVRQLEEEHGAAFFDPSRDPKRCRFHRGMIEASEFWNPPDGLVVNAFEFNPLRRIWLYGLLRSLNPLHEIPADNHLTALDLTGNRIPPELVTHLGMTLRFPSLQELTLVGCDLTDEAAGELCGGRAFQTLDRLILGANPLSGEGRQRLRDHFGERVWFDSLRDRDRWCILTPNESLPVGFGRDHTQLLLAAGYDSYQCGVFDHDGYALRFEGEYQLPVGEPMKRGNELLRELGFQPATVRLKRFMWPGGQGIADYPSSRLYDLRDEDAERRTAGREWLAGWLGDGAFKIAWSVYNDMWINRDGEPIA